jgi:hypothetical protein
LNIAAVGIFDLDPNGNTVAGARSPRLYGHSCAWSCSG